MKLNDDGDLYLSGALARIRGRDNVGITSNAFDDLINNFDGAVYWFKGIQGGRSEGSGTRLMKLDSDGDLEVAGKGRGEQQRKRVRQRVVQCFRPRHNYQESQLGSDAETCHGLVRKLWKR